MSSSHSTHSSTRVVASFLSAFAVILFLAGCDSFGDAPPMDGKAAESKQAGVRAVYQGVGGCVTGGQPSGAFYEICVPDGGATGTLALYAHGFIFPQFPLMIPSEEAGLPVKDFLLARGYDYAATSFHTNGLIRPEAGVRDLRDLVVQYTRLYGRPERVLLFSVSNGALIGTLALEKHPNLFDAAFAACAPIGNFRAQVDYMADMLVLFQHYFPGVIPGGPDGISTQFLDGIINEAAAAAVRPDLYLAGYLSNILTAPENFASTAQILSVISNTPAIDAVFSNVPEGLNTLIRVLVYNVFATNNGISVLGGLFYDNTGRVYVGSADDDALNAAIARYTASASALAELGAHFETKGRLYGPVLSLHTLRDPTVPFWHTSRYAEKLGTDVAKWSLVPLDRYGHCTFEPDEVNAALDELTGSVFG